MSDKERSRCLCNGFVHNLFTHSNTLISDLLSTGQQNARPLRYLKELTGLPGREVRRMIQRERRQGMPILSDNQHGYFLPATQSECERCVYSLRRQASEIMETAAEIERAVIPD